MTREITCPRCATTLRVAPDERDRWLSCPRCLASVPNPYREGTTAAPPVSQAAGPERARCPECDEPIEPRWWRCPNCEAPLRERSARPRRPLDVEVKRDNAGAMAFTLVVALLGSLGVVLFFSSGAAHEFSNAEGGIGALLALLVLVLGALVAGGLVLVWSFRHLAPGAPGVALGVVLGILLIPLSAVVTCCVACSVGPFVVR